MNTLRLREPLNSSKTIAAIVLLSLMSQSAPFSIEFLPSISETFTQQASDFEPPTTGSPSDRQDAGSQWQYPEFEASLATHFFDGDGRPHPDNRNGGSSRIRRLSPHPMMVSEGKIDDLNQI